MTDDVPVLVTGAAGFIGSHVALRLLDDGHRVVGVDNFSPYYDVQLKRDRIARMDGRDGWELAEMDLADADATATLFERVRPELVIHLAAQPGVRYGLENPRAYVKDNIEAFVNVLEGCRYTEVGHLVYASSSSVYGATSPMPFSTENPADHPVSLYAATKRSNELMAHSYSHLFGIPTTGLRFFTVYGPWGRPDMAYWAFAEAMLAGRPITVHGDGSVVRDMTYIDDIVEGVVRVAERTPTSPDVVVAGESKSAPTAPWRILNIGHGDQISVNALLAALEKALAVTADRRNADPVPGDVPRTRADTGALEQLTAFTPSTDVADGLERFADWIRRRAVQA